MFSASPPTLRATGSRKPTGAGFWWRPAGLSVCPDPGLVAAFSPVRRKPATGGRRPGLPGPGVSHSPGQSAAPTPPIFHMQQGSSRAGVRATITGRRFPLDRTPPHVIGPGARRPPPATGREKCRTGGSSGGEMTLVVGKSGSESEGWLLKFVWLAADYRHQPDPSPVGRRWPGGSDEGQAADAAKPPPTGDPHPFAQGRRLRRRALKPSPKGRGERGEGRGER